MEHDASMAPRRMVKEMAQLNEVKKPKITMVCSGRSIKRHREEGTLEQMYYVKPESSILL